MGADNCSDQQGAREGEGKERKDTMNTQWQKDICCAFLKRQGTLTDTSQLTIFGAQKRGAGWRPADVAPSVRTGSWAGQGFLFRKDSGVSQSDRRNKEIPPPPPTFQPRK
jgi:hypothetical protein